jgi:capsular exopolysaccharide synthesis family protein
VHQIRVMLQVHAGSGGPVVYHVTSACPGEGKTSLVASLALSYAAAGHNTLVVDADLIGQRLTHGYGLEERPGFREALAAHGGAKVDGGRCDVYGAGVANLSVMPAGLSDGRDACAISSAIVERVMASLRKRYDVILVDSGPILGSLEALVVSQVSDGVILTISREQQKPLVDRAVKQLKSVGARIAGMVFNKAERSDFRRSVGVTSLRSIPRTSDTALVKAGVTSTSGFGSLVDSVQTYLPTAE